MGLLCNPLWGEDCKVVALLCKKYKIRDLYVIQFEDKKKDLEHSSLIKIVKEIFWFLDVTSARYDSYLYYDEMIPLDKDILDKMAVFEPEALKMLERDARDGRVHDSAERRFIQYHQHLRYWNYFLDRAQIDFFITGLTPHSIYDYIIMRLCKIKKIPVLQMEIMPFQTSHRQMLHADYEVFDCKIADMVQEYCRKYSSASDVELPEDLEDEYRIFKKEKKQIVPVSVQQKGVLQWRIRRFKNIWKDDRRLAVLRVKKHFKAKFKTKQMVRKYEEMAVKPDLNVSYIYFPLHYQPELTTSPLGGWFVHQYLAIEMLSYYVPDNVNIYVKEHPVMKELPVNTRVMEHYEQISKLKHVTLVSMNVSTISLVKHSAAVASITGNAGYEAMYLNKPFLMFGNLIMKYSPGTFNIRNNADCENAMKEIFEKHFTFDNKDIRAFLKAVGKVSVIVEEKKDDNVMKLFHMYEQMMDRKCSSEGI